MSESEQREPQDTKKENDFSQSSAQAVSKIGLPVLRNRTSRVVRRPGRIINLRRKLMLLKRGYREPEKHEFDFWTEEEDATLIKAYPLQTADELAKLFPNRTMNAISKRARYHNLKKSPEVYSAIQSMNSSKLGLANFADYPLQALAQKHPDLKQAYDEMVEKLLMDPAVDPNNTLQVEMIKEAVLSKITQYLMMRDRIDNNCKGKTLIINPKTGFEQWVESRYLHGHEIMNDAKLCRTILKDLGILKDKEKKVEVVANLRMLWQRETNEDDEIEAVDVESRRVD
ncbi:MAG TPA: SANT/Myb-like DNA-binding domain-containing protein [Candidatus Methylomirabilis sp.]|nr:SANT/Myb-like DNA-binding domain-containing protein [Candidatus Methylomirabilis sp.]